MAGDELAKAIVIAWACGFRVRVSSRACGKPLNAGTGKSSSRFDERAALSKSDRMQTEKKNVPRPWKLARFDGTRRGRMFSIEVEHYA